jgi:tetratricopeptide (TPR) repeat protein
MNRTDLLDHPHAHHLGLTRRPCHPFRPGRLAALACVVTAGLGLSACVVPPERPALRVEPSYRLQHAGAGLAQGYALLAQRYEGEARWHEALQAWLKAVQVAPGDANLHNALGQAQAGLGDHEAAVQTLRRAVQLAPDQTGLHNNLGYALMRAGRAEEARAALLQALALQPGYARAEANLRRLDAAATVQLTPSTAAAPVTIATPTSAVHVASAAIGTAGAAQIGSPAEQVPTPEPATSTKPTTATTSATLATLATLATPSAPEAPAARPAPSVEIANGNGVEGMAACVADVLRSRGAVERTRLRNALPYDTATTVVRYRAGHAQAAQALANQLPGGAPAVAGLDRSDSLDLRIVLGHDLRASGPCARRG